MALPSPGNQITFAQIRTELGGSGQQTLSSAGNSLASIALGNQVRTSADLGGTSAGDNIVVDFGTTSTPTYTSTYIVTYREIVFAGLTAGQTVRPYVQLQTSGASSSSVTFYYSISTTGSPGSWVSIVSTSSSGFNSSYYLPTSGAVDYNERLWLRCVISKASYGYMNGTHTITTTYAGTGSISSYTRTSPYTWTWP